MPISCTKSKGHPHILKTKKQKLFITSFAFYTISSLKKLPKSIYRNCDFERHTLPKFGNLWTSFIRIILELTKLTSMIKQWTYLSHD